MSDSGGKYLWVSSPIRACVSLTFGSSVVVYLTLVVELLTSCSMIVFAHVEDDLHSPAASVPMSAKLTVQLDEVDVLDCLFFLEETQS